MSNCMNISIPYFIQSSDQSGIPERMLSAVTMGMRSFSLLAPSMTKLSARAETLKACADGLVSRLARNWVSVTTSTSLLWFTRLSEQLASVKLNLCSERESLRLYMGQQESICSSPQHKTMLSSYKTRMTKKFIIRGSNKSRGIENMVLKT